MSGQLVTLPVGLLSGVLSQGPTPKGEYGDGGDGSLSLGASTTASQDKNFTTLVTNAFNYISGSSANGCFRVRASQKVTVSSGGTINANGNVGGGTGTPGAALGPGTIGGSGVGGTSTAVSNGGTGGSTSPGIGGNGGNGGAEGSGGGGHTGGIAGTVTAPNANQGGSQAMHALPGAAQHVLFDANALTWSLVKAGAGGGGGAGDAANAGGAGGSGGGSVYIATPILQLDGGIQANGGNGGASTTGGRTGDGGGGGGGKVICLYGQKIGSNTSNITATHGAGGVGNGTGGAGQPGSDGVVIEITHV